MKTQRNGRLKPLLPVLENEEEECKARTKGTCFMAGDLRANEQPLLVVMHLVWMREHNRIATKLGKINPHWNDETLYEVNVLFSVFLVKEFLLLCIKPATFGKTYIE